MNLAPSKPRQHLALKLHAIALKLNPAIALAVDQIARQHAARIVTENRTVFVPENVHAVFVHDQAAAQLNADNTPWRITFTPSDHPLLTDLNLTHDESERAAAASWTKHVHDKAAQQ